MWSLFLLASLLSRSISTLADSYVAWQFPAEPQDIGIYDEDTTWALGSTMTLNWTTNLESYPIGLWQGQFGGGAIWINTIENYLHSGSGQQSLDWTVQLYQANLTWSNVFFFWLARETVAAGGISHSFNISSSSAATTTVTVAATTTSTSSTTSSPSSTTSSTSSTTSSTSSTTSSTSSTTSSTSSITSSTSSATSNTSSTTTSTPSAASSAHKQSDSDAALKVGLGVGLGVGVPLVLVAAGFLILNIVKPRQHSSFSENGDLKPPNAFAQILKSELPGAENSKHELPGQSIGPRELGLGTPKEPTVRASAIEAAELPVRD